MNLYELRKECVRLLAPSVREAMSTESGEVCWVLRGDRILCQIWDQRDYWEISFDENEQIGILEIGKANGVVRTIIENLDRRQFRQVALKVVGITLGSWVETDAGIPLVYEVSQPDREERCRMGRRVVLSTFG